MDIDPRTAGRPQSAGRTDDREATDAERLEALGRASSVANPRRTRR